MADELEELTTEPQPDNRAPSAPPEVTGPLPTPSPSGKAFPQLYRFFWGGLLVFVGGMLPFGPHLVTKMLEPKDAPAATKRAGTDLDAEGRKKFAESFAANPAAEAAAAATAALEAARGPVMLAGRPASSTFIGSLFLVFGLMLMGQMYNCIRERKIALGGVLLMFFPCAWTWLKLCTIGAKLDGFSWVNLYRLDAWEFLARDMGSGFLLILGGSTYVAVNFLMAIFGAASGGKKDDAGASTGGAGASKRGAGARRR